MDISARDLDFILTLYRKKSLTKAAHFLNLEQSTLSRQLSQLEERLGGTLFARHQKGLTPSPKVMELIPWAEKIEAIVRNVNLQSSRQSKEVLGEVHISCPDAIGDLILAPRMHEILMAHKGLRLKITGSQELMDLDRLDCDIAIRIGIKPKGDAVVFKLGESSIKPYGHPKFCPAAGHVLMKDLPLICRIENSTPDSQAIRNMAADSIAVLVNRMTTGILAASAGSGVIFIPDTFGRSQSSLVPIPVEGWSSPVVPIYLASTKAVRRLKRVDTVWNWIKALFDDLVRMQPPL
ncbi:LysR family transcriptional regulator [Oligoflexus sp.]|uniref:LysR family transcriptional regulator n=1 Tax=Oligoflexus sp. TaxID=1971216 RepID=UPI002D7799C2|nr:LysR family transcriptional regulator [Oligoflexus sp.]